LCTFLTGQELVPVTNKELEPVECSSESDSDSQKARAIQPDIIASHQKIVKKSSKTEPRRDKGKLRELPNDDPEMEAAPAAIPSETTTSRLVNDYNFIRQSMEIPDKEYKNAREFKSTIQTSLAKRFPSGKLIWYRNWYLKLRNTTPINEIVLYFDTQSNL